MKLNRIAQRIEDFAKAGREVTPDDLGMVEFPPSEHLWPAFMKLRPVRSDSMGVSAWDWASVDAFARQTERVTEPWEIETLVDMSEAYLVELRAGENLLVIPPTER